jgi:hypothetical protein
MVDRFVLQLVFPVLLLRTIEAWEWCRETLDLADSMKWIALEAARRELGVEAEWKEASCMGTPI